MELLQEIGAYAGLAAIPGLAILSALFFSQARDVRRLREWAGRAPERAEEMAQGGRVVARPAAQPQPAAKPAAAAAAATAAPAASAPAAAPAAPAPATAAAATAATGGGGTATAAPPRPAPPVPATGGGGPRRITPRVPGAGHTAILGQAPPPEPEPWYRRLAARLPEARYLAILLVGIAVVGGGIAYGVTQIGSDGGSGEQQTSKPASRDRDRARRSRAIVPSEVSVSVLNGTQVSGLAHSTGSRLEQKEFRVINLVTAQTQTNESVVLFKTGANREARAVADELRINNIEPADDESISQAGDAEVIVVVGADQAPAESTTP